MNEKESSEHFVGLVMSLSTIALQQLGKIANPMTGKVERNLEQVQMTIDMLTMLRDKTKGNLTPKEEMFLNSTLADLQLNYVDELKKASAEVAEKKSPESTEKIATEKTETKKEDTGKSP